MAKAFIDDTNLSNIANAIRSRNHLSTTYLPSQMAQAIINTPPLEEKKINFYDYDGTLLYAFTKEEAIALESLPSLPDRTAQNLTNEGWNFTLQDVKTYAANNDYDWFGVGCTYHTTDNATHLFVEPDSCFPEVNLNITASIANDTTIDWGDGNRLTLETTSETLITHRYSTFTRYDISISSTSGTHTFPKEICGSRSNNFSSKIVEINFSKKCPLGAYTSSTYGRFAFCNVLEKVSFSSYQFNPSTSINRFFSWAKATNHINLPSTIKLGDGSFYGCTSLKHIIISGSSGTYQFFNVCQSLENFVKISSSINIGDTQFNGNYKLKSIVINEGVETIGSSAFNNCQSLRKIVIPSTITEIKTSAFASNYSMREIYVKPTAPPALGNTVFANLTSSCKILVPRNSLSAYQSAAGWSDLSSQMVAYDF